MNSSTFVITAALASLLAARGDTMHGQREPAFLSSDEGLATSEANGR